MRALRAVALLAAGMLLLSALPVMAEADLVEDKKLEWFPVRIEPVLFYSFERDPAPEEPPFLPPDGPRRIRGPAGSSMPLDASPRRGSEAAVGSSRGVTATAGLSSLSYGVDDELVEAAERLAERVRQARRTLDPGA